MTATRDVKAGSPFPWPGVQLGMECRGQFGNGQRRTSQRRATVVHPPKHGDVNKGKKLVLKRNQPRENRILTTDQPRPQWSGRASITLPRTKGSSRTTTPGGGKNGVHFQVPGQATGQSAPSRRGRRKPEHGDSDLPLKEKGNKNLGTVKKIHGQATSNPKIEGHLFQRRSKRRSKISGVILTK